MKRQATIPTSLSTNFPFVINLSAYEATKIKEQSNLDYIEYGEKNDYFQYLIDCYLHSTTNQAIITGVANMIYGKGLDATDSANKPMEYARLKSLISDGELKKVATDRKILGMGAMQLIYDKKKLVKIAHFPMNTLRAGKANDKGEIEKWAYHPDWAKKRNKDEIKWFPSFGYGNGNEIELFVIKPYVAGSFYYSPIDYNGALPYANLEREISTYLTNDVMNGFSGTKVVNFNNNVPPEEKRKEISNDVKKKLTGSAGAKVIVSFNQDVANKTTVEDIPLNDAPEHYRYLAEQCFEKMIVGHRITSPMLLGIRDTGSGLGNNADEIKVATLLLDNITVRPYQNEIIDALNEILSKEKISLNLYFKTIQPIEFTDTTGMTTETKETETGVKMSKEIKAEPFIQKGHLKDNDWILIDESDVDYSIEKDLDNEVTKLNNKKSILQRLGITARPNSKSEQDQTIDGVKFITRYIYSGAPNGEREFCNDMLKANKLYRKEDIEMVDSNTVNDGHGHEGQPYNIFLYKGGVNCKHKWLRQTYMSAKNIGIDVNNPNATQIAVAKAESLGYRIRNAKEVAMIPYDMPRHGHHPEYNK